MENLNIALSILSLLKYQMAEQITLHRSEILQILRHVHDIRTEIAYATNGLYEDDFDQIEAQLLNMKVHLDDIISYFEQEHRIGINPGIK